MSNHYFGITDLGKVRDNNEDAFLVAPIKGSDRVLAAVIDGVGGYEGGEVAASIAKDCITTLLDRPINDVSLALRTAVIETNKQIIEERAARPGKEKMACVLTLALADTAANQFYYAHVGDTRLYLLRGQSLVKVSKDHSFVGFLEESNRITEHDAMRHPKRNEVNKVLGVNPNIASEADYIDRGNSPFLPGDILLLCSDGLSDMISSKEITDILTAEYSIEQKAQALIDAANKAGGKDNVTVVLVQNPKAPMSHAPAFPVSKKNTEQEAEAARVENGIHRKSNPLVWILGLICLVLAGLLLWQYMHRKPAVTTVVEPVPAEQPVPTKHPRNPAEQQLLDSLAQSSNILILDTTAFKSPILISDTLRIDKDTLFLLGNGLVLRGDSTLKDIGLMLPQRTKYVVLSDIVFEHFPIAILAHSNTLKLRNVRFHDCGTAVSYGFHFPDMQHVNGLLREGSPFKTDSLPDKH